jgi:hypothetical protein
LATTLVGLVRSWSVCHITDVPWAIGLVTTLNPAVMEILQVLEGHLEWSGAAKLRPTASNRVRPALKFKLQFRCRTSHKPSYSLRNSNRHVVHTHPDDPGSDASDAAVPAAVIQWCCEWSSHRPPITTRRRKHPHQ